MPKFQLSDRLFVISKFDFVIYLFFVICNLGFHQYSDFKS